MRLLFRRPPLPNVSLHAVAQAATQQPVAHALRLAHPSATTASQHLARAGAWLVLGALAAFSVSTLAMASPRSPHSTGMSSLRAQASLVTPTTVHAHAANTLPVTSSVPSARAPLTPHTPHAPSLLAAAHFLSRHVWRLDKLETPNPTTSTAPNLALPADPAQRPLLRFVPEHVGKKPMTGRLSLSNVCNTLSVPYQLDAQPPITGAGVSTAMLCSDSQVMQHERQLGQQLARIEHWQIRQASGSFPQLQLDLNDGSRWQLTGYPSDELRESGPVERVFIEVAPYASTCSALPQTQPHCLRIRQLSYDAQGVKRTTSEWRLFQGKIEGYQHRNGVRQVLRLRHWQDPHPPSSTESDVYTLDMVLESQPIR